MSSAPVTPVTPAKPVTPTPVATNSAIVADLKWIAAHAILLAVAGGFIVGGVYTVESLVASRDASRASQESAILSQVTQQTKSLQQQLATDEAQEVARDAQYQKTIASLAASIAQRDAASQQQQNQDKTLNAQQAATEINHDVPNGAAAAVDNDVSLPLDTARGVVSNLDLLPVTQADLADTKTQLANQTKITADAQAQVAEQEKLVSAQQDELAQAGKTCDARVAAANAKARKAGIKGIFEGAAAVLLAVLGHSL